MPRISIIIPVYNTEKYLEQCLESVINQTFADIEIICVDDCSKDNSLKILKEYANKDQRIKIIENKTNQGQGASRNSALKIAAGKYVMFLDSDDRLEMQACKAAYEQIEKNQNDFVIFQSYLYPLKSNDRKVVDLKIYRGVSGLNNVTVDNLATPFIAHVVCWNKIYLRKFLLNNDIFFPDGFYEDSLFTLKLFINVKSFSVLNVPLYSYIKRPKSTSTTLKNRMALIFQSDNCIKFLEESNVKNKELFIKNMLIRAINAVLNAYNLTNSVNKIVAFEYYSKMRRFFKNLDKKYDISEIKEYINHKQFKRIINNNYLSHQLLYELPAFIFSIKSVIKNQTKKKVVTILGFKIILPNKK